MDRQNYRNALFAYQAGIFREWDSPAITIGGVEDHVHVLFALSKNHPLKKIVEEVKKGSSKWTKTDGPRNLEFHWQAGYYPGSKEGHIPTRSASEGSGAFPSLAQSG